MSPGRLRLYGLLGLMTCVWSLNYTTGKIALRSFSPLLFSPLRTILAAVCLIPIYLWAERRYPDHATPWTRREVPFMVALGVIGIAINQIFFILGIGRTTVAHASLVIATTPVQVLVLAWLRGQERFTTRKIMGMLTSFGGIAVLNVAPGRAAGGATVLGDVLIFLSTLTFAVYTVAGKEISRRHGSVTVTTLGFLASAVVLIPLGWWQGHLADWTQVQPSGWAALVYMAIGGSVLPYLIFSYALGKIPASRVASFSYSQPLIATLISLAVLAEPVTGGVVIGGTLVLAGVWVVGRG